MSDDKLDIGALFGKRLDALVKAKETAAETESRLQFALQCAKMTQADEHVARTMLCISVVAAGGIVAEIEEWLAPCADGLVSAFRFTKQRIQAGGLGCFSQQEFGAGEYHLNGWRVLQGCSHVSGLEALNILRREEFLGKDERLVVFCGRCYYHDGDGWQELG